MSFKNKPGKTTAWRVSVIRDQVSAVFSYGKIITTITKAKESQKHVDKVITLAKENTLASRRKALTYLRNTTKHEKDELLKLIFDKIAPKYKNRDGGYTRVLKLGKRPGDNTEEAVLELV